MRSVADLTTFPALAEDIPAAMRFLISLAGLAPSSLNSQPWQFRIKENVIEVHGDRRYELPRSDANHREFFMSIGCAIENILIACDYYGLPAHAAYFPEPGEPFFVARIRVERVAVQRPSLPADHLALRVASRHSNRGPYEDRAVPRETIDELGKLAPPGVRVDFVIDTERRTALAKTVADATEAAFRDKGFTNELSQWIKPSLPSYEDGLPGYNIGIPWPLSFVAPLAIRHGDVAKKQRQNVEAMLRATPAFGIVSGAEDAPQAWVPAGQTLERIWLTAEARGLNISVLAAGIEIGEFYKEIQATLGIHERPQVFFRIGYGTHVPKPSPRRRVERILE